jgi:hypothetical protein
MSRREVLMMAVAGAAVAGASLAVFLRLGLTGLFDRPVASWDVGANVFSVVTAPLTALWALVGGSAPAFLALLVGLLWGAFLAAREREGLLLAAIGVPLALAVIAGAAQVPDWLRVITAPWFGSVLRTSLMLGGPVAVAVGMAAMWLWHNASRPGPSGGITSMLPSLVAACVAFVVVASASGIVADRRTDLWATLAGAGDTPRIARDLSARMKPGQVVLNFEGDGSANLFSAARIPVVSGLRTPDDVAGSGVDGAELLSSLMRLSDPAVAEMMDDAGVGYIAIGTSSMYWNVQGGYSLAGLVEQEQLTVELVGSDLTVLAYDAGPA